MKIIKFEGTVEEFRAVNGLFDDSDTIENSSSRVTMDQMNKEANSLSAQKNALKAMLNRIPIPDGQLDIYRSLSNGELEYSEYLKRMDRVAGEVAGVHGALGRRINHTKEIIESGLPGNMNAVIIWRKSGGKDYVSLKPEFIEVLREEGII